jgi:hypothetical protein
MSLSTGCRKSAIYTLELIVTALTQKCKSVRSTTTPVAPELLASPQRRQNVHN